MKHTTATEGNLVAHARRELALIGEDPDVVDWYAQVIAEFSKAGHSGGSASVAIQTLARLLQFENLAPLTSAPDEWENVSDQTGYEMWQNRRNSQAFSDDGGLTYWLLSEGAHGGNRSPRHTAVTR